MFLHSLSYLSFLILTLSVYQIIPRKFRASFLLVASYIFYISLDFRFALLLAGLTVLSYILGKKIEVSNRPKTYQLANIFLNLGTLFLFKYFDFFLDSLDFFYNNTQIIEVLFPIGLSFYVFQSISYTTQIYKQKLTSSPFISYALYLAFFPRLISGPIIRPQAFFKQVESVSSGKINSAIQQGFLLIIKGLFKKIVLADSLAILHYTALKATGFEQGNILFPAPLFWQGFYLYSIMIYADFSGYTDIARGSALLLGFELPINFKEPYLASSLTDFWNRWHMSLTGWFREYIFFPLSRVLLKLSKRKFSTLIQITVNFITMGLIGIWHGNTWLFLFWGIWHAFWLSLEKLTDFTPKTKWQKRIGQIITFHIVGVGWILFRASSLNQALVYFTGMFQGGQWHWAKIYFPVTIFVLLLSFSIDWVNREIQNIAPEIIKFWKPVWIIAALTIIISLSVLAFANGQNAQPFIYGQF